MAQPSSDDFKDFWLASVTILPIIALAIVAEARETIKYWQNSTVKVPQTVKALTSILWLAYSIFSIAGIYQGLRALRGHDIGSPWVGITEIADVQGMATITLVPLVTLVGQATWTAPIIAFIGSFGSISYRVRMARITRLKADIDLTMKSLIGHRLSLSTTVAGLERHALEIERLKRRAGNQITDDERDMSDRLLQRIDEMKRTVESHLSEVTKQYAAEADMATRLKKIEEDSPKTMADLKRAIIASLGEDAW